MTKKPTLKKKKVAVIKSVKKRAVKRRAPAIPAPKTAEETLFAEMGNGPLPPETAWTKVVIWLAERRSFVTGLAVVIVATGSVGFLGWHYGLAAWTNPPSPPPTGNVPGVIWNKFDVVSQKLLDTIQEAAIGISKGAKIGGDLEIGGTAKVVGKTTVGSLESTGDLTVGGSVHLDNDTIRIDNNTSKVGIKNPPSPLLKELDVNGVILSKGLCLPKNDTTPRTDPSYADCKSAWSEVVAAVPTSGLLSVLNSGADASGFAGPTKIGGLVELDVLSANGQIGLGATNQDSVGRIFVGKSDLNGAELQIWSANSGKVNMRVDGNIATGGNNVDSNWAVTTPSLVVKGSGLGTTIKDGVIINDSNLGLKSATPMINLGTSATDTTDRTLSLTHLNTAKKANLTVSGNVTAAGLCIGDPAIDGNCKTAWSQVGTSGNFVHLQTGMIAPETGSISVDGDILSTGKLETEGSVVAGNGLTVYAGDLIFRQASPTIVLGATPSDSSDRTLSLTHNNNKKASFSVSGDITASGQVKGSGGLCIGTDCKTAWSQVGTQGNFVRLQTGTTTPDVGSANLDGNLILGGGISSGGSILGQNFNAWNLLLRTEYPQIILGASGDTINTPRILSLVHKDGAKASLALTGTLDFGQNTDNTNIFWKEKYYSDPGIVGSNVYGRHLGFATGGPWSIEDVVPPGKNFTWGTYSTNPPTTQSQISRKMTLSSNTGDLTVVGKVTGTTGLCIGLDCKTAWPSTTTPTLLQVLNSNSDAGLFTGNTNFGGTVMMGGPLIVSGSSITASVISGTTNLSSSGTFTLSNNKIARNESVKYYQATPVNVSETATTPGYSTGGNIGGGFVDVTLKNNQIHSNSLLFFDLVGFFTKNGSQYSMDSLDTIQLRSRAEGSAIIRINDAPFADSGSVYTWAKFNYMVVNK